MKSYFVTDLDKTIIFSKEPSQYCVEQYEGRNITFMTDKSFSLLQEVIKKAEFVPCTMRNLKQTIRINFIRELNPKFMICTNGAQIYIDGVLDEEWDNKIREFVSKEEITNLIEEIENLNTDATEIRNVEEFYVALKYKTEKIAKEMTTKLQKIYGEKYLVSSLGIKVFLINRNIDKSFALDYLKDKYGFEDIHTAGDSDYDMEFTSLPYVKAYLPLHSTFTHKNAYISNKKGIESTEDILEELLKNIN